MCVSWAGRRAGPMGCGLEATRASRGLTHDIGARCQLPRRSLRRATWRRWLLGVSGAQAVPALAPRGEKIVKNEKSIDNDTLFANS